MNRTFKRIVSLTAAFAVMFTMVTLPTFAEEYNYISEKKVSEEIINSGQFYLPYKATAVNENDSAVSIFKVKRGGDKLPAASVVLNIMDVTAKYGKDYKIKIHDNSLLGEKVEGADESKSVLESIAADDGNINEENSTDALVKGTQLTEEETKEAYKDDVNTLRESLGAAAETSETAAPTESTAAETSAPTAEAEAVTAAPAATETAAAETSAPAATTEVAAVTAAPAATTEAADAAAAPAAVTAASTETEASENTEPGSLKAAKELATGVKSDRQPMDGNNSLSAENLADLTDMAVELNSAHLQLDFADGETEKEIEIVPIDNSESDGERSFQMFLAAGSDAAKVSKRAGITVSIVDDEKAQDAVVGFEKSEYYPQNGYIKVTVKREGAINQVVSVKLTTKEGSAVAERDFSPVDTSLMFPYGIKERTINIPVRSDYVGNKAEFTMELSGAVSCTVGGITEAKGIISAGDVSIKLNEDNTAAAASTDAANDANLMSDATTDSILTGKALNLSDATFTKDNSGYTKYDSTVGTVQLHPNSGFWYDDGYATAYWKDSAHYDYSGWRINWKNESSKSCWCDTKVQTYNWENYKWEDIYNTSRERWNTEDCDIFFSQTNMQGAYIVHHQSNGFLSTSPTLSVYSISPILRPFEVTLKGSDPLKFLDGSGNYIDNTGANNDEVKKANSTTLENASDTGKGTAVKFSGNNVSVTTQSAYAKITGLKIVSNSGESTTIDGADCNISETNASFTLTNDFLTKYKDYITFADNGSKGKKGQFGVQAILAPYDTQVTIEKNYRGKVEISNSSAVCGTYRIKNAQSGNYLLNEKANEQGNVFTGYATNDNRDIWTFVTKDAGYYMLKNGSDYVMDITSSGVSDGTNVQTYQDNGTDAQRFKTQRQSDGSYVIYTKVTGAKSCLDIEGNGTNVVQKTYSGSNTQKWILEPTTNESQTYTFHKGDTLKLTQSVNDDYSSSYTGSEIKIATKDSAESRSVTNFRAYDDVASSSCIFLNTYYDITVTPNFDKNNNKIVVKVPAQSLAKFDQTKGIFTSPAKTVGQYKEFTVADNSENSENKFSAGRYCEFTAVTKDPSANVAVWSPIHRNKNYSQETFYFMADKQKEENVIYLDAATADSTKYSLSASAYYADDSINGSVQGSAWLPSSGVVILMGNSKYGITNEEGKLDTIPAPGISGDEVIYKLVSSGSTEYKSATITQDKLKEINDSDGNVTKAYDVPLGNLTVGAYSKEVPHANAVSVTNMNDVPTNNIVSINDDISRFTTWIGNDHSTYKDSDNVSREEKVTAVDYIVVDPTTNGSKSEFSTSYNSDNKVWTCAQTFKKGVPAQYSAGDKLYVRITTDRYVGNGKSVQVKGGEAIDNAALQQTVYAPVFTGYTFTESNPQAPVTHDVSIPTDANFIKLPLIGDMNSTFKLSKIALSISELPGGGQRLAIGFMPKWKGKDYGGAKVDEGESKDGKADDGVKYGITNMEKAWQGVKDFGSKAHDKASLGMKAWALSPIFGLYFDFGIKNVTLNPGEVVKKFVFIGGGIYIGLMGTFRIVQYFIIGVVPCYFGVDGSLAVFTETGITAVNENTATLDSIKNESGEFDDTYNFAFCLQANAVVNAYVGAGLAGTLGVRGGISFNAAYIFNPTIVWRYPNYHMNGLVLSVDVKVWLDALIFSIPVPVIHIYKGRYGYYKDIAQEPASLFSDDESADKTGGAFMKARTSENSKWVAPDGSDATLSSTFEQDGGSVTIMENSYDRADAKLLDLGDGRIMAVFLADGGTARDDADRTVLEYSIYKDGAWSTPVVIQNDGTADFEPNVTDAGDKVLIAWTSRNNANAADDQAYIANMDVYATTIDKTTLKMGNIDRLTEDNYYDAHPVGMYDSETGDMLVYYLKTDKVSSDLETSLAPQKNESVIVYMLYDGASGTWQKSKYYESELAPSDTDGNGMATFAETEKYMIEHYAGQRFLKSVISNFGSSGTVTDPTIVDFDAISYNGIGIYTYTVDEDNNMDTTGDRELFIQEYDFKTHTTYVPTRITNDTISESRPQLVRKGDATYLFWLENEKDVKYLNVTELIKNGLNDDGTIKSTYTYTDKNGTEQTTTYEPEVGYVSFSNSEGEDINPTFGSFKPYVDKNGNLFIVWLQPVKDADGKSYQEVYASALVDAENGSCWSDGVRLTNSGKFNDEVALVTDKNDNLMIVNNQYDMDLTTDDYAVSNSTLVSTGYKTVGSVEATEASTNDQYPTAGSTTGVKVKVRNSGLKPASGYTMNVYQVRDGVRAETPLYTKTSTDRLVPSASVEEKFDWTMPADLQDLTSLSLFITVQETGMENISEFAGGNVSIAPYYDITAHSIEEKTDGFYANYTVCNIGNKDASATDVSTSDAMVIAFNDCYSTGKTYDPFLKAPIGDLAAGETKTCTMPLTIADSFFDYGFVNAYMEVQNPAAEAKSKSKTFTIDLDAPYKITINGDADMKDLMIAQGNTLALTGTYAPSTYYTGGEVSFATADDSIASINDGKIVANAVGTTTMTAAVLPYGGEKKVNVTVTAANGGTTTTDTSGGGGGNTTSTYSITFDADGGSGAETIKVNKNGTITDLPTPTKDGYTFDGWYTDQALTTPFDPTAKVTANTKLYAKWTKNTTVTGDDPFKDVSSTDWFYSSVMSVYGNKLMAGTAADEFSPNSDITRGMLTAIIYRAEGSPETTSDKSFSDVSEDSYYAKAIAWAKTNGIVKGFSETEFAPDKNITREQLAAVMYRYAVYKNDGPEGAWAIQLGYSDTAEIAAWASESVMFCKLKGIMQGDETNKFRPAGNATRAEFAAIIQRYTDSLKTK